MKKRHFLSCQNYKATVFETKFKKVDQDTGGKWLIHSTKQHKDNQLQSLELPIRIS